MSRFSMPSVNVWDSNEPPIYMEIFVWECKNMFFQQEDMKMEKRDASIFNRHK